ncbi:ABC1 kinase family protein [Flaviflexus huanghaiensis]|uniref:ABC1 kinase family protein n=1 Tax=Flaviflexus huanghaiensis TaxID=1111473 RepID=UPI0015F87BCB|nr:AarF/UbiB family protein [Flaviflexus huanghaiensis]
MTDADLRARYRKIVFFFARVVANFVWWEIVLRRLGLGAWSNRTRAKRGRRTAVRFRRLAVSMGGLMIKVGQFLSARLDVLPREITQELSGLQDEVPPEHFEDLRRVADAELPHPLEEQFAWVSETPLAAASLGQVHRARLHPHDAAEYGFTDVVVKVQRPNIREIVETDLAALRRVGGWMQRYRPIRERADAPALVEEFAATTLQEIDYLAEASNAETFAANFSHNPQVSVPSVVWDLTGRRVLTLEDVSAIKLGDNDAITAAGVDRAEVAKVLADTYLQQILTDGFFHADPHPGNLFVTPCSEAGPGEPKWILTFIDFGMIGRVPENLRSGLRELLIGVGLRDSSRMLAGLKDLDVLLPTADLAKIEEAAEKVFERFAGLRMDELQQIPEEEMVRFALQFRELLFELPFQIPEDLLLLGRSIGILSGICTGLDPEFDVWATITPYATQLLKDERESTPQTIVNEVMTLGKVALGLPRRADTVLRLAERGELRVATPVLSAQMRQLQRSAIRIKSAIIFAALLVAGAVLSTPEPVVGWVLMGLSVIPLVASFFGGRRGTIT